LPSVGHERTPRSCGTAASALESLAGGLCHALAAADCRAISQARIQDTIPISAPHDTSTASQRREYRRYLSLCVAIIALALVLKLPSLHPHGHEDDELIFWHLTQNWLENGTYSLQGTPILKALPSSIYDKPLFHHPPLLPMLMAPFVATNSPNAVILVAWFGHVMAIVGVAIICWTWRRRSWRAADLALWLPVLAVAVDPLMTFAARKLWPDDLAGGLAGLAMGFYCLAGARRSPVWAVAGGVAVGLAGLAKLPGLLILPAGVLMLIWSQSIQMSFLSLDEPLGERSSGRARSPARSRLAIVCLGVLPAFAILVPWFVVFYGHYHALLPTWIRPDAALRALSSHVDREMRRPWHFYLSQSAILAPVIPVVLVALAYRMRRVFSAGLGIPVCWVGVVVLALLLLRLSGHGMQMRYLTPAVPGVYAMLAGLLAIANPRRSLLGPVALLAVLYGVSTMGFFLYPENLKYDDIVPVPEILWRMWTAAP